MTIIRRAETGFNNTGVPQDLGHTIYARQIEQPQKRFIVEFDSLGYVNIIRFADTRRRVFVLAKTPEGALAIARYHHCLRGANVAEAHFSANNGTPSRIPQGVPQDRRNQPTLLTRRRRHLLPDQTVGQQCRCAPRIRQTQAVIWFKNVSRNPDRAPRRPQGLDEAIDPMLRRANSDYHGSVAHNRRLPRRRLAGQNLQRHVARVVGCQRQLLAHVTRQQPLNFYVRRLRAGDP